MYQLKFNPAWDIYFSKMDPPTQQRIMKKIEKQANETKTRHMRFGVAFYVVQTGQYRIALKIDEIKNTKEIWFAGTHKQYEEWYEGFR